MCWALCNLSTTAVLRAQARPPVVDDSIEKDVGRTFPRVKRCAALPSPSRCARPSSCSTLVKSVELVGVFSTATCPSTGYEPPQDMSKQSPTHRFTTPAGLASLERVLKAYAAADPEVNYCQARLLGVWTLTADPTIAHASKRHVKQGVPPGCVGMRAVHCGHPGCVLELSSCLVCVHVAKQGSA